MERVLCAIICIVVVAVAVHAMAACVESVAEATPVETTVVAEPTQETEPPKTEPLATEPPATEPKVILYDVPLGEDLQLHIIETAESYGINPAIIIAMAYRESTYRAHLIGDGGDSYGLLQVQPKWHSERMQKLGCTDLLDPFQNVTVAVDYLAEHFDRYGDIGMALTAYNAGPSGAQKNYFSKGIYASKYATEVMAYADEI